MVLSILVVLLIFMSKLPVILGSNLLNIVNNFSELIKRKPQGMAFMVPFGHDVLNVNIKYVAHTSYNIIEQNYTKFFTKQLNFPASCS